MKKKISLFSIFALTAALANAQCNNTGVDDASTLTVVGSNTIVSLKGTNSGVSNQFRLMVTCTVGSTTTTVFNSCQATSTGNGQNRRWNFTIPNSTLAACGGQLHYYAGAATNTCPTNTCALSSNIDPQLGIVVPVKLVSFTANAKNNIAQLNWATGTELNFKEFVVQAKAIGEFQDVATIVGKNSPTGSTYSYTAQAMGAKTTYRLKMVDLDGRIEYSEERLVTFGKATRFVIYPNPVKSNGRLTLNNSGEPVEVTISNTAGKVVRSAQISNSNSIALNRLANGFYLVSIKDLKTGEISTQKLSVIE